MSDYATLTELREWSGAQNVSDAILLACLAEAEASLRADLGIRATGIGDPLAQSPEAFAIAHDETLRRAQRNLARRNSPEGVSGMGDLGVIRIPARDPDTATSLARIRSILEIPLGVG